MWLLPEPLLRSSPPTVAPPGYYLLFILKLSSNDLADGVRGNDLVPSVGSIVQLGKLTSIAVTPANPTIQTGKTQQFAATGTYLNGRPDIITSQVTWTSSSPTVATINVNGLATGASAGTTTISAALSLSGTVMTGSTTLTVQAAPAPNLTSIAVTPADQTIQTGTKQQFTAEGTYSDNSKQIITNLVAWASSTGVATFSTPNVNGLATGVSAGSTTISATLSGVYREHYANGAGRFRSVGDHDDLPARGDGGRSLPAAEPERAAGGKRGDAVV